MTKTCKNTLIDLACILAFSALLAAFSIASYGQVGSGKPSTSDLNMQNHVIRNSTYYGTGAFGTSSAQNSNVTGTARDAILWVTNPSGASVNVAGASTANTISTSVAGGVFNGDFSLGSGTQTGTDWIGSKNYGWYATQDAASSSVSYENGYIKLVGTTVANTKSVAVKNAPGFSAALGSDCILPRVTAGNTYRFSFRYKLDAVTTANSEGFYYQFLSISSDYSANTNESQVKIGGGSVGWTTYSKDITITTGRSFVFMNFFLYSETGTVCIDDIKLEQIDTQIATAPPIDTFVYPTITGVTSEFVDQSATTSNTTISLGKTTTYQKLYQTFIPTKTGVSAITLSASSKVNNPTNIILDLYSDNAGTPGTLIASIDSAPTWSGEVTFPIFGLVTPGTTYGFQLRTHTNSDTNYYVLNSASSSVYASGVLYYWNGSTWSAAADSYFKVLYSQNTNNFQLSTSDTANTTSLKFGDIGLPDGAVLDLERGKFTYTGLPGYGITSINDVNKFAGTISSAVNGGNSVAGTIINGWLNRGGSSWDILGLSGNIVSTINTGGMIKECTFTAQYATSAASSLYISVDGVNWVAISSSGTGGVPQSFNLTTIVQGYSSFHVKLTISGGYTVMSKFAIEADIDTSSINLPVLTPTGGNDLYASVNGGSYKAGLSSKYYSNSLYTASELNQQEISKMQASAQATRDRITPVTTGVVAELVASASGALVRSGIVQDATGMWRFEGEVSVGQLTDRTPYFIGDSIAEIMAVTTIPGTNEIDHKSLGSARVPVAPEQELKFMDVLDATGDLIARVPGGIPIREITETIPAQKLTTLENTMLLEESVMLDDFSPGLGRQAFSGLEYSYETPEGHAIPARDILVAIEEYSFSEALASVGIPEASAAEIRNTTKIIQYDRRDIGWSISRLEDSVRKFELRMKMLEAWYELENRR